MCNLDAWKHSTLVVFPSSYFKITKIVPVCLPNVEKQILEHFVVSAIIFYTDSETPHLLLLSNNKPTYWSENVKS